MQIGHITQQIILIIIKLNKLQIPYLDKGEQVNHKKDNLKEKQLKLDGLNVCKIVVVVKHTQSDS